MQTQDQFTVSTISAFTGDNAAGNPAGICFLESFPTDAIMQDIAHRVGHSETAFLVKSEGDSNYHLRWFTPMVEAPLCGHATIAAVHYLSHHQHIREKTFTFYTLSGKIQADINDEMISITLPVKSGKTIEKSLLSQCVQVPVINAYRSDDSYVAEVADMSELLNCRPNLQTIAQLDADDLIVTTIVDGDDFDYAYRCFSPQMGIDEDPVTGSANCTLASYWSKKLKKTQFKAFQASTSGGVMDVTLHDMDIQVSGTASTRGTQTMHLNEELAA